MMKFVVNFSIFFVSQISFGSSETSLEKVLDISSSRQIFSNEVISKNEFRSLIQIKKYTLDRNWKSCLTELEKTFTQFKVIEDFLRLQELICLVNHSNKGKKLWERLATVLLDKSKVVTENFWVSLQYSAQLKVGLLKLMERDVSSNGNRAWKAFDRFLQVQETLAFNYGNIPSCQVGYFKLRRGDCSGAIEKERKNRLSQQAYAYELAGDLSLKENSLPKALRFWSLSLLSQDKRRLREKLKKLEKKMGRTESSLLRKKYTGERKSQLSSGEAELQTQIASFERSKNFKGVLKAYGQLCEAFPGSSLISKWANSARESFLSLLKVRAHVSDRKSLEPIQKIPLSILSRWIGRLYRSDQYRRFVALGDIVFDALVKKPKAAEDLLTLGKTGVHIENWSFAQKVYQAISFKYTGDKAHSESVFRLALVHIRQRSYSKAVPLLKGLTDRREEDRWRVKAMYWLWRCYQKLKSQKAQTVMNNLIDSYPFYYYGLRAQVHRDKGVLDISNEKKIPDNSSQNVRLSAREILILKRYRVLAQGGWFREAAQELRRITPPSDGFVKLAFAKLFISALNYNAATNLLVDAWNDRPVLKNYEVLKLIFPREYPKFIEEESARWKLDPAFVWSLIRQESLFSWDAKSRAGAMGLMQIMPLTARDIKSWLRLKEVRVPQDLNKPKVNVAMGSHYLFRLIRKYQGHIPLALSAYNAGPGNTDRWLKNRKSLKKTLYPEKTPDVFSDLWVEELPWNETVSYIYRILRNWIVYKAIEKGQFKPSSPIWLGISKNQ